jgi:hypothetical protein
MQMSAVLDRLADMGYNFYHDADGPVRPTQVAAREFREADRDPQVEFEEDRQAKVHLRSEKSGEELGHVYIAPNHLSGSDRTDWVSQR